MNIERYTFTVNRTNNGKFTLKTPINNIKWLKITNVYFKHGPKKHKRKTKRKKNDSDDSDDDYPYENGNTDLIYCTYIGILVNDFIRGKIYDEDGNESQNYTTRIFNPIDEDTGEGDWDGGPSISNEIRDWEAIDNSTKNLEEINISTFTNDNPYPVNVNYEIELEFGINV